MIKLKILLITLLFLHNQNLVFSKRIYTKAPININDITILELQETMDNNYLTSELLVKLDLERIEEYNSLYNAITFINENAIEIAKELDKEREISGKRSLLHGIPVVIKDNIDILGLPTTGGARALLDSYPKENAFIVQKLIDAGAIIIAKTNMSTFAFSGSNSISSFKTTYNAYNPNYSSYGSSGGTAVAIATNLGTIGIGTDTNSSVRGPAAVNNIIGLRPTMGLVSRSGILPYSLDRDIAGPMTRTVTDLAIMLDFMVGYDENDTITEIAINNIPSTYTKYLNEDGLKGKRIGVINDFIKANPNSDIPVLKYSYSGMEKLMEKAISDMEKLGAKIIYIDDFYTPSLYNLYNSSLDGYLFCYDLNQYFNNLPSDNRIRNFNDLIHDGRFIYNILNYTPYCNNPRLGNRYQAILTNKEKYKEYVLNFINKYNIDVFAYPTFKTKPITTNNNLEPLAPTSNSISPTTGFPSINVPMGFDDDGLSYGLHFTGLPFEEGTLIEIAYAYEQKTLHRKPPEIAPNLYEVPIAIDLLIEKIKYIESELNLDIYTKDSVNNLINSLKIAKDYLINYNDYNIETQHILRELEISINNLEFSFNHKLHKLIININYLKIIYITMSLILITFIIKIYRLKKKS